jgi:hypothetical protein
LRQDTDSSGDQADVQTRNLPPDDAEPQERAVDNQVDHHRFGDAARALVPNESALIPTVDDVQSGQWQSNPQTSASHLDQAWIQRRDTPKPERRQGG